MSDKLARFAAQLIREHHDQIARDAAEKIQRINDEADERLIQQWKRDFAPKLAEGGCRPKQEPTWLWPLHPPAQDNTPNMHAGTAAKPGDTVHPLQDQRTGAVVFELPDGVADRGDWVNFHRYYRPTEADLATVGQCFPGCEPGHPNWTTIEAELVAAGCEQSELRGLRAPAILAKLVKARQPAETPTETAAAPLDELVDLDQCAALVSKSKRTLERAREQGKIPDPDYPGGGGKAHRWKWSTIRPALQEHFRPDLPERFPGSRIV